MINVERTKDEKSASKKLLITRIFVYAVLVLIAFICLFPFVILIINASRSNAELQAGFTIIPSKWFFANMKSAWTDESIMMGRGLLNSLIIAGSSAALTTYFSALTAYGIHVYDFKFKKLAYTFILAIMMIPAQVSAVGFVQICNKYHLTNNYLPLIVPAIAAPVTFFYMKQYMESILPMEIVESARVDGAGEFYTFNKIVLPLLKPAIAVQAIFSFVGSWNNYFTPALLLEKKELKTVPIMVALLRATANSQAYDLGKIYMFILLAIIPVLIVYFCLSKFIISGLTAGSVKG